MFTVALRDFKGILLLLVFLLQLAFIHLYPLSIPEATMVTSPGRVNQCQTPNLHA